MIVMFFVCIGLTSGQRTIPLCNENCATDKALDLDLNSETVQFEACPEDLVKLEFRPEENVNVSLRVTDDHQLYYTNTLAQSEDVVVISWTNGPLFSYSFPQDIITTTTTTTTTTTPTTQYPTTTLPPQETCDKLCEGVGYEEIPVPDPCCKYFYACYCMNDATPLPMTCNNEGASWCPETKKCVDSSTCNTADCCPQSAYLYQKQEQEPTVDRHISVRYSCQKRREVTEEFEFGSGDIEEILEPNTELTYNFKSDDIHNIAVNLTGSSPIDNLGLVRIGNGMYALGYGHFNLSIQNTETNSTEVKVRSLNTPLEGGKMVLSYQLGEERAVSSTTTTTTTSTPSPEKVVEVFILAVNEGKWVAEHFNSTFRTFTRNIVLEVCPDLNKTGDFINYAPPYSCRRTCFMTNDMDRGCVMLGMDLENIPQATQCNTGGLSNIEYFRQQLETQRHEMRRQFSAARVEVDSCTEVKWTTEWLWVSIGLVLGGLLLAGAIMCIKRQGGRRRGGEMDDTVPIVGVEKEKRISSSRRERNFEIIGENEENYRD